MRGNSILPRDFRIPASENSIDLSRLSNGPDPSRYLETPIPMVTYESIVRDVLDEPVGSLDRVDEGWTNIVLEVNRKWIFRFVRDPSNT